jgi:MSHA biogenesis protein MshE
VEAAHITWRPLGRLLVEQGLLSGDDLERALAEQQVTGERLGETIVKLGMVSGPELANALAAQYGIELTTEKGFGTGLRSEIQRRHESDRRQVVHLVPDPVTDTSPLHVVAAETAEPELAPEPDAADAPLLAQLEEQWAKLAAAEEALVERERELEELARSHDRGRAELAERERELTELAESRERELAESAERERELRDLAESRQRELAELSDRARELSELAERPERELAELTERHERDLRQREEVNERLREQIDELRRAPGELPDPVPTAPASHLVFVQLDERYELISRDGPPPAPSTPLSLPDIDEGVFVVAGHRSSPLPGDARPCVFVQRG